MIEYNQNNKEKKKEYDKEYNQNNKEKKNNIKKNINKKIEKT